MAKVLQTLIEAIVILLICPLGLIGIMLLAVAIHGPGK